MTGRPLPKALPLQDAWWTLFWALDRLLLAVQLEFQAPTTRTIGELERRSDAIERIFDRIRLYRSRIDSTLVSAGARDLQVWQTLADAWNLPFRIGSLDRKLDHLLQTYSNAAQEIVRGRAARVNIMIYAFTAFGVIASAVAVVQFAQGGVDDVSFPLRMAIIVLCSAIAMIAVALSLRVRLEHREEHPLASRR